MGRYGAAVFPMTHLDRVSDDDVSGSYVVEEWMTGGSAGVGCDGAVVGAAAAAARSCDGGAVAAVAIARSRAAASVAAAQ